MLKRQEISRRNLLLPIWERTGYDGASEQAKGLDVRVIARPVLRDFWAKHAEAEQPLKAWLAEAGNAAWRAPQEIKDLFRNASFLSDNRVVFNIGGNKYRLVVHFHYEYGIARIKFIGTHAEYDAIDAETI